MKSPRKRMRNATMISVVLSAMVATTGCSSRSLPKGAIGNLGQYNYSPSVIETGNMRQFWWCSPGVNPTDSSQSTDAIYYESVNLPTSKSSGPRLVMAETPGSWDSALLCNPKVVGGIFKNPLGDGHSYKYAMYYVATQWLSGDANSIGVAFSDDGIRWKKYPYPVIPATTPKSYGVGQPSVYNSDHKAAIFLLYEDTYPTLHHVAAASTDGVHFRVQGTVTSNGLDSDYPEGTWGDVAYDSKMQEWYAIFNRPLRPAFTTGNVVERGQYGIELYKIRQGALLTGSSPWQQLVIMDTNSTGFESNFLAGFVRGTYGDINVASYPTIEMYTTISYPSPSWDATPADAGNSATVAQWILMPMKWVPDGGVAIPFNRFFNGRVHEVTTGWISPDGDFKLQQPLGHLYASPVAGATVPLYGCKRGQTDYFVSLDVECEGERVLGKQGYAYSQPVAKSIPLYRCSTSHDHFVSQEAKCEGETTDGLLGYAAP